MKCLKILPQVYLIRTWSDLRVYLKQTAVYARFQRFNSTNGMETCTNRLIMMRTLCDILCPWRDGKNNCRCLWLGFCSKTKSLIPSFKSNRFNCYFQAAAAIIHHLNTIKSFFASSVIRTTNLKIQSVQEDIHDLNLMNCHCPLAIFYLLVCGPYYYWMLVNSSASYSEFCLHIRRMNEKFVEWSTCAASCESDLLDLAFVNLFGTQYSLAGSPYFKSVLQLINV